VSRPAGRRGEGGISLVELVVVLAIGGLVLVLAFGGQGLLAERRLSGATRKLLTDIRTLEQRARAERTCYRILFDRAAGTYTMERYAGVVSSVPVGNSYCYQAGDAWVGPVERETPGDAFSRRMPRGVEVASTTFAPADTLVISPLGNPNAGTVTLRSAGGATRRVVVEPFGRVRIAP
jgi:type II secretory pathway pseudopilin PulG